MLSRHGLNCVNGYLPIWQDKGINKIKVLSNAQISWRVGEAGCEVGDDAVVVTGEAVTYLKGVIFVDRV